MDEVKVCKTCGEKFEITEDHKKWFESKELKPPTHCGWCRYLRKEKAAIKLNHLQVV